MRHKSSDVGGSFFRALDRRHRSILDLMDRVHACGERALKPSLLANDLCIVQQKLRNLFGAGQGLSVSEAVAGILEPDGHQRDLKASVPQRMLTHIGDVFANFASTFDQNLTSLMSRRHNASTAGGSRSAVPLRHGIADGHAYFCSVLIFRGRVSLFVVCNL